MKRKLNSSDDFRSSASSFREEEHNALRVNIQSVNDVAQIIDAEHLNVAMYKGLQPLILTGYNKAKVFEYDPSPNDGLAMDQRKFLTKLRLVLINNHPDSTDSNCEDYVHDLAIHICNCADLDDGMDLILRPCNLRLNVDSNEFATKADREGRRGRELVCILQEEKHRGTSTYHQGDLQIACAMIAASQHNYRLFNEIYPRKILGIKIVAEKAYFCCIRPSKEYINELTDGLPKSREVTLLKFPETGYSLDKPDERGLFLQYLSSFRSEVFSLEARKPV